VSGEYLPTVDPALCIGSANCVHAAPRSFELDDRRKAVVIEGAAHIDAELQQAERSCPTAAVRLTGRGA